MSEKYMPDSNTPITILRGCAADAPHVHALMQPFVDRGLLLDRTIDEITFLSQHSMAAECGGKLIGFAAVEIYSKKLAEIQCMAVQHEFQQRGVGKRLVAG
jgi:amino-acid N-acetyltransferase